MPISYNQRNRRWVFQFNRVIAGKRHRADRLLPKGWTRTQADEFDRTEVARLYALATGISKPDQLIEDAVLLYLEKHAPQLKNFANIRRELAACLPAYQEKLFGDLPEIAQSYRPVHVEGPKKGAPLAAATVRNRLAYLRAACRYAWKTHGMGEHNPAERVVMPIVRNERQVYLGRPEFLSVLREMAPGSARAAVRIAFYSGMRANEVQTAKVKGSTFELADTKNGRPRHVPIHPKVAHVVRNPTLWPIKPTRWTVSIKFRGAADAAGFPAVRLHDMRHSAASAMINEGIDLFTVGGVLGHKSAVSTRRYSHLATDTLSAAINTIGKNRRTLAKKKAA
jgi:integrase